MLSLEALCEDGDAIDLQAFNAPGGGFVVARDLPRLRQQFTEAFARQPAALMEERLNAVGVPTYGLTGFFGEVGGNGAHGLNEKMRVRSLYEGRDFLYEVVKLYANQK